jgi:molecular chaperone GrpE
MAKETENRPETPGDDTGAAQEGGAQPSVAPAEGGTSAEDLVPGLADAVAAEELEALRAEVEALKAERDELKDRLMRALADAENIRRRAERDRKDAETYGGTKLARDLLSVHDNLERAMEAADEALREAHPGFIEGVELTRRELLNAFAKHDIQPVHPEKGEKFDPNRHQAMFEAPVPGATPGTVMEVMQSGFMIADRLLRPALVGVAKAAPEPAEAETGGGESSGESGGDAPGG